jgi:hypothetical protein
VNSGAGEGLAVLPFYKNNPTLLIYIVKSDKSIVDDYGTALTTILPILFLYLNTVIVTAGNFEP